MKDNIEQLFENLDSQFDIEVPNLGHQQRFIDKLNKTETKLASRKTNYWKPLLAVAASVVLILSIVLNIKPDTTQKDLASISPELAETQNFFSNTIAFELNKLKTEKSPETQTLVNDALLRLDRLELEYKNLKLNLTESGEDQRVIYAMITNFQNRIDVLQSTLLQIEALKTLKQNNYETTI
jgi:DNA-directed RNA polymerase beta' subunit